MHQTAMLESPHDTELDTVKVVVSAASDIAQMNAASLSFHNSKEVLSILELTVNVKTTKKGGPRPKTTSALGCLYRLQANQNLKGITRLLVVLLRVGGFAAMKVRLVWIPFVKYAIDIFA